MASKTAAKTAAKTAPGSKQQQHQRAAAKANSAARAAKRDRLLAALSSSSSDDEQTRDYSESESEDDWEAIQRRKENAKGKRKATFDGDDEDDEIVARKKAAPAAKKAPAAKRAKVTKASDDEEDQSTEESGDGGNEEEELPKSDDPSKQDYAQLKAFIEKQVRLISKPFEAAPELFEDAGAPKLAAVQTAVRKINENLRKEIQLTFSHQSRRQVLEQLMEQRAADRVALTRAPGSSVQNEAASDLTDLDGFPEEWPEGLTGTADQRRKYADTRARVFPLTRSVSALREKLEHYKSVVSQLETIDVKALHASVVNTGTPVVHALSQTRSLAKDVAERLHQRKDAVRKTKQANAKKAASSSSAASVRKPKSAADLVLEHFHKQR